MSEQVIEPQSYRALDELLSPLGSLISPAELHGHLCGKLSGGARPSDVEWLLEAVELLDFTQAPDEQVRAALTQLYQDTHTQLQAGNFELALVLPSDSDTIGARLHGLSQWCHGFLTGFGSAGEFSEASLGEEITDALQDYAAIVQLDAGEDGSEADYMEVVEYVRVAAMSMYMECAPAGESASADGDEQPPTLH
ncbi:UPF0149 family protein [Marinimicrobium alkaliphilum]|uniref:UPF0149 family protein n=1 Tax=Marinimicrobium alkaliphilum TaxID=2202654 RepID=UPI000DB9E648|nr:UPF0149 family protein [Marinimicrobium alkaliphilum]